MENSGMAIRAFYHTGESIETAERLVLVEREVDADSVGRHSPGACCIATGKPSKEAVETLAAHANGRPVVLCFNNDRTKEGNPKSIENKYAGKSGAKSVIWPYSIDDVKIENGFGASDLEQCGIGSRVHDLILQISRPAADTPPQSKVKSIPPGFGVTSLLHIFNEPKEPDVIVEGLLYRGGGLVLNGPGGGCKSQAAVEFACDLATASPENPSMFLGKLKITKPQQVLIIQSENVWSVLSQRIHKNCAGRPRYIDGLHRISFFHRTELGDITASGVAFDGKQFQDDFDKLLSWFRETIRPVDVLIIDPLISFLGDTDENSNVQVRKLLDSISAICRRYDITPVLIHHNAKGADVARGASALIDWARAQISFTPEKIPGRNIIRVTHEKSNNFKKFEPFQIELDPDYLLLHPVDGCASQPSTRDLKEKADIQGVYKTLQRMGGTCKNQSRLAEEYAARTGVSPATAKRHVQLAKSKKYILEIWDESDGDRRFAGLKISPGERF